jgi:tetratricopeptide (TPR) repeat protein
LDPKDPEIWFDLGDTLSEKGSYEKALSALGECTRLDPKFAPAYFSRGKVLLTMGLKEEASNEFFVAFNLVPDLKKEFEQLFPGLMRDQVFAHLFRTHP